MLSSSESESLLDDNGGVGEEDEDNGDDDDDDDDDDGDWPAMFPFCSPSPGLTCCIWNDNTEPASVLL